MPLEQLVSEKSARDRLDLTKKSGLGPVGNDQASYDKEGRGDSTPPLRRLEPQCPDKHSDDLRCKKLRNAECWDHLHSILPVLQWACVRAETATATCVDKNGGGVSSGHYGSVQHEEVQMGLHQRTRPPPGVYPGLETGESSMCACIRKPASSDAP